MLSISSCRLTAGLRALAFPRLALPVIVIGAVLMAGCTNTNQLRRWYAEALEHERLGRTEQARERYQEILAADPEFPGARNNLAVLDAGAGREADAAAGFGAELVAHPALPEARLNQALLLVKLRDQDGLRKARGLVGTFPTDPRARLILGQALLLAEEAPEDAIAAFDFVIANGRDTLKAHAHFGRGVLRARAEQWEAASADFATVARLRPDAVAHYNHAVMMLRLGRHRDALRDLDHSAALDANAAPVPHLAATIHLSAGDLPRAAEALQQTRALEPERKGLDLLAGVIQARQGQWPAALASFKKACASDSSDVLAQMNRAYAALAVDDLAQAHAAFETAARLQPDHPNAAHNTAMLARLLER